MKKLWYPRIQLLAQKCLLLFMLVAAFGACGQQPVKPSTATTVDQLRIIPCSKAKAVEVAEIEQIATTAISPQSVTQEANVPPPKKAVDRVDQGITIRYFDPAAMDAALKLQKQLQAHYQGGVVVRLEDMRPFYASPMKADLINYLEVWLK